MAPQTHKSGTDQPVALAEFAATALHAAQQLGIERP